MSNARSNINQATFSEIYLAKLTSEAFSIPFTQDEEIIKTVDLIQRSHPREHRNKIITQKNLIKIGLPQMIGKVTNIQTQRETKLKEVCWVGNKNRGSKVADIELKFEDGYIKPISVKAGGLNTERNLGSRSLSKLTGFDLTPYIQNLLSSAKNIIKNLSGGTDCGVTSLTGLKKKVRTVENNPFMLETLKFNGYHHIQVLSDRLLKHLSEMNFARKIEFVKYIAAQNSESNIEVLIMEDTQAYFKTRTPLENINEVTFSLLDNNSTTIMVNLNRKPVYRVNINNTNGLGVSPFAFRVFAATSN